jgi:uncharacterized membrane protein YhaH (DUF805 family)
LTGSFAARCGLISRSAAMDWVYLLMSFEGRISRKPFWIGWAVLAAAEIAIWLATQQINDERVSAVTDLVILYPQFAVCAKRGHDRNTPTWVIGLFFALSAAFDLLLLGGWITSASLEQKSMLAAAILVPIGVFALVLIIDLGFRRGTPGPNRYGPDPLEGQT